MEFLGIRTKSGAIVQPNSGEEMIRQFDFTHATPGLTTGVVVYNPTVGDILLDAWIEVTTAFNGTTPHADLSQFNGGNFGWYGYYGEGPIDLTFADDAEVDSAGLISAGFAAVWTAANNPPLGAAMGPITVQQLGLGMHGVGSGFTGASLQRLFPARITSPNPIKLVVSQDGKKGSAASGATQGAGTVYFLTGTPQ